jgi:hypothetical protein
MTAVMKATVAAEAVIKPLMDSRVAELHRLELQEQTVPVTPFAVCVLHPTGNRLRSMLQERSVVDFVTPANEVRRVIMLR